MFSHQELAIATFLDKDVLAFQEKGVKLQDGIMGSIQANSIPFTDRHLLASVIADKIRDLQWNTNWRNELKLGLNDKGCKDGFYPKQQDRRWYHINVRNLHRKRIAQDCIAYLESSRNVSTGEEKIYSPIEFKWRGLNVSRVIIPPKYSRDLDAFYIPHNMPTKAYLAINSSLVDFAGYIDEYTLNGSCEYELNFVLFSMNFSPVRTKFKLQLGSKIDDVRFYEM